MKTFIASLVISTLPLTSIIAAHHVKSHIQSTESQRIKNLPVSIELPSLSEIETEWLPEVTVEVVVDEIEIEHIPSHRVR